MTLKKIMEIQKDFDRRHAGRSEFYVEITDMNVGDLEHLLVCLMGEVGEISNIAKKIARGDPGIRLSNPAVKAHVAEEAADVFIYLVKICNQLGVDLEAEYVKKLDVNEKRFRKFKR